MRAGDCCCCTTASCASLRIPVGPCAFLWGPVHSCGALCNPVRPCASMCNPVHPCASLWGRARRTSLGPTHPHCASLPVNCCAAASTASLKYTPAPCCGAAPAQLPEAVPAAITSRQDAGCVMDIHCTGLCHWWCRAMAPITSLRLVGRQDEPLISG
jgi:hypothetical protein